MKSLALPTALPEEIGLSSARLGLDPLKIQGSYGILNARIGIGAPDGKWAFEVWGQNLADKGYFQVGFDAPFQGLAVPGFNNQIDSFVGDPRTFGATLRVISRGTCAPRHTRLMGSAPQGCASAYE